VCEVVRPALAPHRGGTARKATLMFHKSTMQVTWY